MSFVLDILCGEKELDPYNDNVDVEIKMDDGRVFSATFFTIENIKNLLDSYQKTGECLNGLYMWAVDMIIVNRLTEDVIRQTISNLVENGELDSVCALINR